MQINLKRVFIIAVFIYAILLCSACSVLSPRGQFQENQELALVVAQEMEKELEFASAGYLPAQIGQQAEVRLSEQRSGSEIKLTSFKPRVVTNIPDGVELEAILKMSVEPSSTYVSMRDDKKYYRFIYPLYYKQSCLQCHGTPQGDSDVTGYPKEGVQEGNFAGAISILIPVNE